MAKDEKKASAAEARGREAPRAREGARGEDQGAFGTASRAGEAPRPRRRVREQPGSGASHAGGGPRRDGAAEGARDPARGAGSRGGVACHAAAVARDGDGGAAPRDDRPAADGPEAGGGVAGGAAGHGGAAGDPGGAPGEAHRRRRGRTGPARRARGGARGDAARPARARTDGARALGGGPVAAGTARSGSGAGAAGRGRAATDPGRGREEPDRARGHVRRRRVADQGAHAAARTFGSRAGDVARRSSGDRLRSPEPPARGRDRGVAGTTRWAGPSRCAAHGRRLRLRSLPWRNVSPPRRSGLAMPSAAWTRRRPSPARGHGPRDARTPNAEASAEANGNGNGKVDAEPEATIQVKPEAEPQDEATPVDDGPPVPTEDGSELRSRLVRSTDARRRGISTPTPTPTPGPSAASAAAGPRRTCRGGAGRSHPTAATPARASRSDRPSRRARRTWGAALPG